VAPLPGKRKKKVKKSNNTKKQQEQLESPFGGNTWAESIRLSL
jgi:hypothetical protein